MSYRQTRLTKTIKEEAAKFFSDLSNRTSLITVADINLTNEADQATIYISVLPPERREEALKFCKRHAGDLRTALSRRGGLGRVPYLEIKLIGENPGEFAIKSDERDNKKDHSNEE